jgi:hypothetical protein
MLLLGIITLVMTIPLASLYLSTILIHRIAFLIILLLYLLSELEILGGLFQTLYYSNYDEFTNSLWTQLLETSYQYPNTLLSFVSILLNPLRKESSNNNIPDQDDYKESSNSKDLHITFKTWLITNIPAKEYLNSKEFKTLIYKENNKCTGIYLWLNNINGKYYIGSAKDLRSRLARYFSPKELARTNNLIQKAIIKHKHENFSFYVLEYCNPDSLIAREQFYIDSLTPPYNILKVAGNSTGFKHTEETKELISKIMSGENHPNFGKSHCVETITKMSNAKGGGSIFVYDTQGTLVNGFSSARKAAKNLNSHHLTIMTYAKNGKLFKKKWYQSIVKDSSDSTKADSN